ncbi:hypothetical protein SKAU_G00296270 [Synaphobranchus kaupii]|uniref:Granulins domain-containing protein n=1 Tax=Synaphobranchus kaupii TaxID=118154 RepID=A0A9Q1IML2_SYNKA|nr:hypothetical protein SKAU_G00296270 [Synaphobranchus kaupii]
MDRPRDADHMMQVPRRLTCDWGTEMLQSGVLCLTLAALSSAITCPDGGTCDDGSACCQTNSGGYGCCPLARPLPMVHASSRNDGNDTTCPDGSHCPSEYSCLQSHNAYKCCPLGQGVSCSDGKHCCPEHHRCGEDGHSCIKEKELIGAVICPDGESECPEATTCCQVPDSSWGCCPLAKAVCCEDRKHCCPEGSSCDAVHSKCNSPTRGDSPMWAKFPARRREAWEDQTALQALRDNSDVKDPHTVGETSVTCPDGKQCPDLTTCCQLSDGSYGCCPFPNAVCCSDHLHCCPSGNTCDLVHSTCTSANSQTPLAKKIPASNDALQALRDNSDVKDPHTVGETSVTCPDGKECPDLTTCCQLSDGSYGCCPFPNAVCCSDHLHCCPSGNTCDLVNNTCTSANSQTPLAKKIPASNDALQALRDNSDVKDPAHRGRDLPDGTYGCCPFPNAVCCSDHLHCCPSGNTCDLVNNTCTSANSQTPLAKKIPASNDATDVPCNDTVACEDGSTCCKDAKGDWACCPLPKAVCCEDHIHCCPNGSTCDGDTCNHATGSVPWLEKVPALTRRPNKARNVTCDSSHTCPDGNTCCKTAEGDWACCPLPEAVCCEDHTHCCPKGTTCDVATGACSEATGSVPWLEKSSAVGAGPRPTPSPRLQI